jgi:branched-chain amino acid aminotransferase
MVIHRYFIRDDEILATGNFTSSTGIEIYEVLRVMKGVPLFLDDHLKRFFHSAWMLHLEIPLATEELYDRIYRLVSVNEVAEGNIRFSYCFRPAGRFQAYFIPHSYPDPESFRNGVDCGLLYDRRLDPNVKAVQSSLRDSADRLMLEKGYFEVFLVNEEGRVTEGSRSNLFFVKGSSLVTAPDEEVLPGITRKKVLQIAEDMGVDIILRSVPESDIKDMDAAFITGTSPKVLPVRSIGPVVFSAGRALVHMLAVAYNEMLDRYISSFEWKKRSDAPY